MVGAINAQGRMLKSLLSAVQDNNDIAAPKIVDKAVPDVASITTRATSVPASGVDPKRKPASKCPGGHAAWWNTPSGDTVCPWIQ